MEGTLERVTEQTIRGLAERARASSGLVVSLYLDLDPETFSTPEARSSQIRSLLNEARTRFESMQITDRDQREGLRRALETLDARLAADVPAGSAGSLAVFCQEPGGMLEMLKLPRKAESAVRVAASPWVEPLLDQMARELWFVVLINRRVARFLRGTAERLREIDTITSDTEGQHEAGGWSQARFERSVEKQAQDHWRRTADALYRMFRRNPFDRLVVVAADEIWPEVEQMLRTDLRKRLVAHLQMEIEHSSVEEVQARVSEIAEEHAQRARREALERLAEAAAVNGRAAMGVREVLWALNERRVGTLLYDETGGPVLGLVCPRCGQLELEGRACPVDGESMDPRDDIIADAIARATEQSAELVHVSFDAATEHAKPLAAILRF